MVWIHGGAFVFGASSSALPGLFPLNLYDGCTLSSTHNVLVAAMNYRLGPLGFSTFEDKEGRSGNFGIKDQRLALVWLQNELNAFGGDPAKVTLFGESAGGMSVFHHIASPLSKGLFRAAISESGFPTADQWSYRQTVTAGFAAKLQCEDTDSLRECLRGKNATDIISNAGELSNPFTAPMWNPVIDGEDMPEHPVKRFHDGRTNRVPFMAGTNTDEGNLFVWPMYGKGMNESQYEEFLQDLFGDHDPVLKLSPSEMAEVISTYQSASTQSDRRPSAAAVATDSTFLCGTQAAAQAYGSTQDMFLYRFNHRSSCRVVFKLFGINLPGVYHSSEMLYVWGDPLAENCVLGPEEHSLSLRMQRMWTDFAKNLTPNSTTESFPKYTNSSRLGLVLQTGKDAIETDYRGEYCKLWQNLEFNKLLKSAHRHRHTDTYDVMV